MFIFNLSNTAIVLFILSFIFLSCESNNDEVTYPIEYLSTEFSNAQTRVFTVNGEVSESVKNDFINRHFESLTNLEEENIIDEISIIYLSDNSININNATQNRIVYTESGIEYWETQEIGFQFGAIKDNYKHFKYRPRYLIESTTPSAIQITTTEVKECFYAINNGNNIKIEFIDFYHKSINGYITIKNLSNKFKPNSYNLLLPNDTIMVQEYNVTLK